MVGGSMSIGNAPRGGVRLYLSEPAQLRRRQNCHDLMLVSHHGGRRGAPRQIEERGTVGSRFAANNSKNSQAHPGAGLAGYTGASSLEGFRNL